MKDAEAQGAAVVLGGDLNAALATSHRPDGSGGTRPQDKGWLSLLAQSNGTFAAKGVHDTETSWQAATGTTAADLDHILVFPASLAITALKILPSLEPGLDHLPVAATLPDTVLGSPVFIAPDPGNFTVRVQTQNHSDNLPALQQAVNAWWEVGKEGWSDATIDDSQVLEGLLHQATAAYADIAGYTSAPSQRGQSRFALPGHRKLHCELDALF